MAKGEKTILLVRHGATGPDWQGRYIGATDLPLAGQGPEQARRLAERLAPWQPQICLVSPMRRARETAALAALQCPQECDDRLREVDFGDWEGCSFAEISRRDPDLVAAWAADGMDFCFPHGERRQDFVQRVRQAMAAVLARPEQTILLVTHGGVIRTLLCLLLGLAPDHYLLFDVRPAGLAVVTTYDGRGVLTGLYQ